HHVTPVREPSVLGDSRRLSATFPELSGSEPLVHSGFSSKGTAGSQAVTIPNGHCRQSESKALSLNSYWAYRSSVTKWLVVHWFSGSLVHWFIGSLVHWFTGSLSSPLHRLTPLSVLIRCIGSSVHCIGCWSHHSHAVRARDLHRNN